MEETERKCERKEEYVRGTGENMLREGRERIGGKGEM